MQNNFLRAAVTALILAASPAVPAAPPNESADSASIVVHKTPSCGCCGRWVQHLQHEGFHVVVKDSEDLAPIKQRLGIPSAKASCHTAEVAGYFVEGHVPAGDIRRLLRERTALRGLLLPGMPAGSPGMEMPDGRVEAYTVQALAADGTVVDFAQHSP